MPAATIRQLAREELARRGVLSHKRDFEQEPKALHDDGKYYPLHEKQRDAWNSDRRYVAIFAGNQSGKTVLGPPWLAREMQRRGPGDYGVIGPTYPMLDNRARPELERFFEGLYRSSGDELVITEEGERALWGSKQPRESRILFRHAQNPESIEAMVLKGLWVDEPGQIDDAVWRAIQPRIMANRARVLLTSRPMLFNWYVSEFWHGVIDEVTLERLPSAPDDRDTINYPTWANPNHDPDLLVSEKLVLTDSEYRMRYLGIPTRPAGAVYDCFDERVHVYRETMVIPEEWPRYVGLDFGPQNTAAVIIAGEREQLPNGRWGDMTGRFYAYREYHGGSRTVEEHVQIITEGKPERYHASGGNKTGEQGWRGYFTRCGLTVHEPRERLVEVGIQYVYRLIKTGRLFVSKDCPGLITDLKTYAYKLDDQGNSTGKLDPQTKSKFHFADALRGIAQTLFETAVYDDPEPIKPGSPAYYQQLVQLNRADDDYHYEQTEDYDY